MTASVSGIYRDSRCLAYLILSLTYIQANEVKIYLMFLKILLLLQIIVSHRHVLTKVSAVMELMDTSVTVLDNIMEINVS